MAETNEISLSLGQRLRNLRKARGISLKELSSEIGISIGMLSQIERAVSVPSLRSLRKLAIALDVSLGWFFEEGKVLEEINCEYIIRKSNRKLLKLSPGGITKYLASPSLLSDLELLIVTIEPGGTSGSQAYTHKGVDAGFVVKGMLNLVIDGTRYVLAEGDSFGFPSSIPHRFENGGDTQAQIVWINTVG